MLDRLSSVEATRHVDAVAASAPQHHSNLTSGATHHRGLVFDHFVVPSMDGARRVDAIEALAAKYAADWPAWGHRKIAAMLRADGHEVSTLTV